VGQKFGLTHDENIAALLGFTELEKEHTSLNCSKQ
jgi:hypothetical protein